jgi:hypothetical protein
MCANASVVPSASVIGVHRLHVFPDAPHLLFRVRPFDAMDIIETPMELASFLEAAFAEAR